MAIYEIVMVNNLGAVSQFVESDTEPTIKEMNVYFDRFMVDNRLNRVSDVICVTKSQFDKWNKGGKYKLHRYTPVKTKNNNNAIQAKCIQKFRDEHGKIYGYRLIDLNGQTQDVKPDMLKKAILNGKVNVVNLTLTSDNRLVDTAEKQLQSKELGAAPNVEKPKQLSIEEVIALKLTRAVNGDKAKCELEKGLSNSCGGCIDEYFETDIEYGEHEDIVLGIFIDTDNLFISLNNMDIDTIKEWNLNINGGYKKHLKEIETFIQKCAKEIKNKDIEEDYAYKDVAKALVVLEKETIGMGDSYEDIVEGRTYQAYEYIPNIDSDTDLDKLLYKSFLMMLNNKVSEIEDLVGYWEEYETYDTFENNIQYENVNNINNSTIYKALTVVYKYAKEKKFKKDVIKPLYDFLSQIKTTGIAAINMGYNIGHRYYTYLDKNVFGTISNNVFTVGNSITASDIKEFKQYKGYNYVLHKDINKCGAPSIALAAFFKNTSTGDVQVDIKIERHGYKNESMSCGGTRGYILDVESFVITRKASPEDCAKILAQKFNNFGTKLYDLADVHQSLYSGLKYKDSLEKVSLSDLNSHGSIPGKELVDLAISRWTKIRGSKTPAKIATMDYRSDTSFGIIYANNISDSGNDRRLYIKYNGKEITLKVVDGIDINKVIIEKTEAATGSIVDNSPALSEVIARALIEANVKRI